MRFQSPSDEQKKIHKLLSVLKCIIWLLTAPKNQIPPDTKRKIGAYERCIKNFVINCGTGKSTPSTHQVPVPQLHVQTMSTGLQKQQEQEQIFISLADCVEHQTPLKCRSSSSSEVNVEQEYEGVLLQHQSAGPHSKINSPQVMRKLLIRISLPQLSQLDILFF